MRKQPPHPRYFGCGKAYVGCGDLFLDLESWNEHVRQQHSDESFGQYDGQTPEPVIYEGICCTIGDRSDGALYDHKRRKRHRSAKKFGMHNSSFFDTAAHAFTIGDTFYRTTEK